LTEIDKAFPSTNDPLTFANTQDLPYLNAVINEGMRVMPVVNTGMSAAWHKYEDLIGIGLSRITTDTTVISDYEMPPGVSTIFSGRT
jgi:cytochrome P450